MKKGQAFGMAVVIAWGAQGFYWSRQAFGVVIESLLWLPMAPME